MFMKPTMYVSVLAFVAPYLAPCGVALAAKKVKIETVYSPVEEMVVHHCMEELATTGGIQSEACLKNFTVMSGEYTCSGKPIEKHSLLPVSEFIADGTANDFFNPTPYRIYANFPAPGRYTILVPTVGDLNNTYYVAKEPCTNWFGVWICSPVKIFGTEERDAEFVFTLEEAPIAGQLIERDIDICSTP